jgi:23S rRNA pseudouridine2604 synthase
MHDSNSIRLNKYISESGICSRREADRFIEQGAVFINGQKAKIGRKVFPGDKVVVNGNEIEAKKEADSIYIAFNKPPGITCTTEDGVKDNIVNFIRYGQRIFPIGRLDKDSQGLIFLTNNGDIVNKILRAGNQHEKEYLVTVNKPVTDDFIAAMGNGVHVLGQTTKKCFVKKESTFVFRIILIQGLNRQIRRMCEHFKYEVVKLERVRIMNISLKGIPIGEYREFTQKEIDSVNEMVKHSGGTEDASKKRSSHKTHQPKNNPAPQQEIKKKKPKVKHTGSAEGKKYFKKFKDDELFAKKKNSSEKNSSHNNHGKNKGGKKSHKKSAGRWDLH